MRCHWVHLVLIGVLLLLAPISSTLSQTLFSDDFSGDLSLWSLENSSYWSIVDGWLDVDMPANDYTFARAIAGDVTWTDYRFEYDVVGLKESAKISYFRYHDPTKGYFLNVRGYVAGERDPGALRLFRLNNHNSWPWGSWTILKKVPFVTPLGTAFHVAIVVIGPEIVVYVDGVEKMRYVDTVDPVLDGKIGFAGFTGAEFQNQVRWDNVSVTGMLPVPVKTGTWGQMKGRFKTE